MSFVSEIGDASLGWLDLLAARPDAMSKFAVTRTGQRNALLFYALVVLVNLVVSLVVGGAVEPLQIALGLLAGGIPLLCLWLVTAGMARLTGRNGIAPMVTGIYAFAFVVLVSLPLSLLIGNVFGNVTLGILGYFFYRSGRGAAGFGIGLSIVYAVLTVLALVVASNGLYMLVTPSGG